MRKYQLLVLLTFFVPLILLNSGIASGQSLIDPAARQGYYIGTGVRIGNSIGDSEDVGDLGQLSHFGFAFRGGQKPLPWLGLGLLLSSGGDTNDDWESALGGLMLEVQIEPFPFNLAFRGAIGVAGGSISRTRVEDETDDDPSFMFGSNYIVGISYDWFPFYNSKAYRSGGGALTFFAEGRLFPGGDVTLAGGFVGVEFTWWTGLNKRKLRLPVEKAFE
ncbi:MAG: hypothetical protein KTR25_16740 [Myxococcales bacterium]|nr:hypothetical protein [Myxococcales bacterium]